MNNYKKTTKYTARSARTTLALYQFDNEYFCISVARSMNPTPDTISSVTIGFLMNADFKSKVAFWHDPKIPVRLVNETCERCLLQDCQERAASAHVLKQQIGTQKIEKTIEELVKNLA
ncbi:MAG: hypothetical protein IPL33_13225 [Sphingobacteriales bacterium]|nr:hypothetical protein [Sphingobacteriales bacterium]